MSKRAEAVGSGPASPPPAGPAGPAGPGDPAAGAAGGADSKAESAAGEAAAGAAAARIAELEDQYRRALADADNIRKRRASQVSRATAQATADVAARFLPVVDNLERALAHSEADPGSIITGVRAVRDQARSVLASLGYPRRDDQGARFDPARHEAIASRPADGAAEGEVIEVLRPAYGDGDHQLRPAQVVVARAD